MRAKEAGLGRIYNERSDLRDEVLVRIRRYLGTVERNAVSEAARHGFISDNAAQEVNAGIDARLVSLHGSGRAGDD